MQSMLDSVELAGESTQTLSTHLGEHFNKFFLGATSCSLIIIELGTPQS